MLISSIKMNTSETFIYNESKFKIISPYESSKYIIILSDDDKDYDWIDKLNKYCIMNNLGLDNLDKIKKKICKYCDDDNLNNKLYQNEYASDLINEFDQMEHYTLKSKLQNIAKLSISPLNAKKTYKTLFNKETVQNLIINEFLDCTSTFSSNKNIKVSLIDDNIYVWNIEILKFKNNKLNNELQNTNQSVNIKIIFHSDFYPNYPPIIKILNPHFNNSLIYRISNSKMTQLDYWTPSRSIKYIIDRTINVLERHASIDFNRALKNITSIDINNLESNLIELSSFTNSLNEDDEIDFDLDETFIKFNSSYTNNIIETPSKKGGKYGSNGTGYGNNNSSSWNIDEYIQSQKDKDLNLIDVINNITNIINKFNNMPEEFKIIIEIIEKSQLIQYLKQQFSCATILEIHKKEDLFNKYIKLIENLSTKESIFLFDNNNNKNNDSLFNILDGRFKEFENLLIFDKDDIFTNNYIKLFKEKIFPIYTKYKKTDKNKNIDTKEKNKNIKISKDIIKNIDIKEKYKNDMQKYRFNTTQILSTNYKSEYKDMLKKEKGNNWKMCQKRLASELTSLMSVGQLPVEYDSSIFICIDEDNPMVIRTMITGPVDTPYDSGCFIFDLYISSEYPNKFTDTWFMNHGGNRLNPNLYDNGKVCLSILGTWSGTKSEMWNPETSTLLQVLISIQSQILIETPYFNEPGYADSMGTPSGKKQSDSYNDNIKLYTMKSTVRDLLINPKLYPQFEDAINMHFKLKKDHILKTYKIWCDGAPNYLKKEYTQVYLEIENNINKLI
jgi:ubiquitin-protein ligase